MRCRPLFTLFAFVCALVAPLALPAQLDYSKAIGAPVDGRLRSSATAGLKEAYLVPIFPSAHAANLLELKNGDLLCAWFSGTWEGDSDVTIVVSRLAAGSNEWTKPMVVDHHQGESYQNPVLFEAPDGVIWLFHTTQGAGEGQANSKVLLAKSKDGGKTWDGPSVLFDQPGAFVRHPVVVLADGTWMLPMYFTPTKGITDGSQAHYSVVKLSSDQGRHWKDSRIPNSNGYVQPSIVRLKNGKYLAFLRSRYADNIFRSTSDDGKTWSAPQRTQLPNNNASIQAATLSDGNVVIAFNNVGSVVRDGKPKTGPRKPLSVAMSKDGGESWTAIRDLETGELPPGAAPIPTKSKLPGREEFSYASILQTRQGLIHVAYTYRRYTIKDVVFSEDWLSKGSTVGVAKGSGSEAAANEFDRLYVFGDSYSDIGEGYLDGNGPTAVAYLAKRFGLALAPSNAPNSSSQSLDFAVSGAQTGRGAGRKVENVMLGYGMENQVEDFAGRVHSGDIKFDAQTTLFFIAGGLNDSKLQSETTIGNLEDEIKKLYALGARHFALALLPTAIPSFSAVGQRLNPELSKIPDAILSQLPDAQICLSHWGQFFDDVMHDPSKYGIANTKDACAGREIFHQDATPCASPETYFYYHAGHPSTAVHKTVGDKLYDELSASPGGC
jgi:predicted neuraminidase